MKPIKITSGWLGEIRHRLKREFSGNLAESERGHVVMEPLESRLLLSATPLAIAQALDLAAGIAVSYSGDTEAVQVEARSTTGALLGYPSGRDADFLVASSGIASEADSVANTSGDQGTDLGDYGVDGDTATISFTMSVPDTSRSQKFKFDFTFLSEEYPEWVGTEYNDFFSATVDGNEVALDELGNVVNVNNVHFDGALSTAGTFFDGRTVNLTGSYSIPDGETSLDVVFSIGDVGDGIYDSAVFLDNVRIEQSELVHLDFDGVTNLNFSGGTFNMNAFAATQVGYDPNPGDPNFRSTADVITDLVTQVRADYSPFDIDFVTAEPTSGDFMTVYVGDDTSVVASWGAGGSWSGQWLGMAQAVDVGNLDRSDAAIVRSDVIGICYNGLPASYGGGTTYPIGPANTVNYLSTIISHEAGHNLGLRHITDSEDDDIMAKYDPRQGTGTFKNELMNLGETGWPDTATTQNDYEYLKGVLGLAGTGSMLAYTGWGSILDFLNPWIFLSLPTGQTIYNVKLGTIGNDASASGLPGTVSDIAPQIVELGDLSGIVRLQIPRSSPNSSFFLIGSSVDGGEADITTGNLDDQGNLNIQSAAMPWPRPDGTLDGEFTLSQLVDGALQPLTQLNASQDDGTNQAPHAIAGGPYWIAEGQTVTLDASGSSDVEQSSDTLTYEWDLDNDGIFGEIGSGALRGDEIGVTPSFSAADLDGPGSIVVSLKVTDSLGESDTDAATVNVSNVAPPLSLDDVTAIVEDGVATLTGTITDPGTLDAFTLDVNWGDLLSPNNVEQYTFAASASGSQSFTLTHQYLDDNPTATPSDSYTILATVTDDDTGAGSASTTVTVANVAPQIESLTSSHLTACTSSADGLVTISGSYSDIGTQDMHTIDVDWGDSTPVETLTSVDQVNDLFDGSHTYAHGGIFEITVTVTDDDGGVAGQWTTKAVVQGVGEVNGILYVIGTEGRDHVKIKMTKGGSDGGSDGGKDKGKKGKGSTEKVPQLSVDAKLNHTGHSHGGSDGGSDGGYDRRIKAIFDPATIERIVVITCDGNDHVQLFGSDGGSDGDIDAIPAIVLAGAGDDKIKGGSGADVLVGGQGDDKIDGRGGNDVLIGGNGQDDLKGGRGEDILISGMTLHDKDLAALEAMSDIWNSGDDYANRIDDLTAGTSGVTLDSTTVSADGDKDKLKGEKDLDWFMAEATDKIKGRKSDEQIDVL